MTQVRVRFAPSPTGELHVGGARTALFNWLFARRHKGVFVLRIEDTDIARSSEEMSRNILKGMQWLGLDWDEGPHYQSRGRETHEDYARSLLEAGAAYYDFSDPEELAAEREQAQKAGVPFKYDRRGMEPDLERARKRLAGGEKAAVRFKVPEGETVYTDLVHGEVRFQNEKLEDFVVLRNDGSPTYMLSVVADDVAMGITHVIRGDDHIPNTPKQILLYQALGHTPPTFAHLPLILGPDKKKLSKRHGGNTMRDYMEEGYLPVAVFNFLALLGWNPGDEREIMERDELVEAFDFAGVGTSPAVFDVVKLESINSRWINRSSFEELFPFVREEMMRQGTWSDDLAGERREWLRDVIELLRDRSKRTWDLARDGVYFFHAPEEYDAQAVKKFCKGEDLHVKIAALADRLESVANWNAEQVEAALRALAEELEIGAGKLIHPLRIGITGVGVTPDVFTIAGLLGREQVVLRLHRFAEFIQNR